MRARHAILKYQIGLNERTPFFLRACHAILKCQIELNKRIDDFHFESTCMHRSFCEARTFLFFTFFQFSRNSHFHAFGFCQTFSFGRRVRFLFFEPFVICWFLSFGQFSKFQHFEISWISVCSIIRDFSDLAFT